MPPRPANFRAHKLLASVLGVCFRLLKVLWFGHLLQAPEGKAASASPVTNKYSALWEMVSENELSIGSICP